MNSSHILLQGGGKIAIRYKSPGNINPESVRIDLDDGDSESIASHSSWPALFAWHLSMSLLQKQRNLLLKNIKSGTSRY